jgi:hypothetical protein
MDNSSPGDMAQGNGCRIRYVYAHRFAFGTYIGLFVFFFFWL